MLKNYKNGNATVSINLNDGSRTIEYIGELELEYPLNVDIRVSTQCSFGFNPDTGGSICDFCHESATTDGVECDYEALKKHLGGLPAGIELAIGGNKITNELIKFLVWGKEQGYICNLTVNQGHVRRDRTKLLYCVEEGLIMGLGISYRPEVKWNIPQELLDYNNTVFHVIAGIDEIEDVLQLPGLGVKKLLVLGEKDFGFNTGSVDLNSQKHNEWVWWTQKLFNEYEVVSFDNLAIEQIDVKRFFGDKQWQQFNQGEHSIYVNAVEGYFAPSSRNPAKVEWDTTELKTYFQLIDINHESKN